LAGSKRLSCARKEPIRPTWRLRNENAGMGFHIKGHMNGIWSQPLKLLDSYQSLLDNTVPSPAQKFTSGRPVSFNLISGFSFSEPSKPWYALIAGRAKECGPQDAVQFVGVSNLGNVAVSCPYFTIDLSDFEAPGQRAAFV
jgi:hypothetical protein